MESRQPLTELSNQRQPRRKQTQTYGKKRGNGFVNQAASQELFGQDQGEIEEQLAGLKLDGSEVVISSQARSKPRTTTTTRRPETSPSACLAEKLLSTSTTTSLPHGRKRPAKFQTSPLDVEALAPLLKLADSKIEIFSSFGERIAKSCGIEKIGEGSFAEVFKLTTTVPNDKITISSTSESLETTCSIVKIIPLLHPTSHSSVIDRVSAIPSVAREVNILKHLDILHGFTGFASLRIVQGAWPKCFLDAFRKFKKHNRKRALNAAPDEDFDNNQLYALVEMDDAGVEVALIKKPSLFQIYDIFWTTVVLLVNAEEQLEFEHRDLHLSNICVRPDRRARVLMSDISQSTTEIASSLDIDDQALLDMTVPPRSRLGLSNLEVSIIDYTVSRARLPCTPDAQLSSSSSSSPSASSLSSRIEFDDMEFVSQPFDPASDPESALQFSTYKKCRFAAQQQVLNSISYSTSSPPSSGLPSKYSLSTPVTNTIWLGYLLRCLLRRNSPLPRSTSSSSVSTSSAKRSQIRKPFLLNPTSTVPRHTSDRSTSNPRSRSRLNPKSKARAVHIALQEQLFTSLLEVDTLINGSPDTSTPLNHMRTKTHDTNKPNEQSDEDDDDGSNEEESKEEIFHPEDLLTLPQSAKQLLELGVENGWISKEEILEVKMRLERE